MKNNIVCSERAPLKAGAGRGEGEKRLSYSRSGGDVGVFVAVEPLRADMRTFTRIKSICSSRFSTRRLLCFSWSPQPGSGSRDLDALSALTAAHFKLHKEGKDAVKMHQCDE